MNYVYPYRNADEAAKRAVWEKGRIVPNYDSSVWRHDACGHVMKYTDHANTSSPYGWEIDHIYPAARGGLDTLDNLQPLYWLNNRRKGDTYPWYCENAA